MNACAAATPPAATTPYAATIPSVAMLPGSRAAMLPWDVVRGSCALTWARAPPLGSPSIDLHPTCSRSGERWRNPYTDAFFRNILGIFRFCCAQWSRPPRNTPKGCLACVVRGGRVGAPAVHLLSLLRWAFCCLDCAAAHWLGRGVSFRPCLRFVYPGVAGEQLAIRPPAAYRPTDRPPHDQPSDDRRHPADRPPDRPTARRPPPPLERKTGGLPFFHRASAACGVLPGRPRTLRIGPKCGVPQASAEFEAGSRNSTEESPSARIGHRASRRVQPAAGQSTARSQGRIPEGAEQRFPTRRRKPMTLLAPPHRLLESARSS